MKFELTGKLVFEAKNTEDAFQKLALHFSALAVGIDSKLAQPGTNIQVRRVGVKTPPPPSKRGSIRPNPKKG